MAYRIILVDDEKEVLHSLERALHDPAYTIVSCLSAEDGLKAFQETPADLVISDYMMKGMSGIDFLERVIKDKKDTITILLTGYADLGVAIEAINKSALYQFILKPWNNDELKVTVKHALALQELMKRNKSLIQEIKGSSQANLEPGRSFDATGVE